MPELPDIALYIDALRPRVLGQALTAVRIKSPFLLRTFEPPPEAALGRRVRKIERIGKRIALEFDGELAFVFHLMIAGRFLWKPQGTKPASKIDLATFEFETGTLLLTEASPKKRASLHVVVGGPGMNGRDALAAHDPGGLEPLECTHEAFIAALTRENRTIKRVLTDPHVLSGIGNAYSDEILFAARLSPVKLTRSFAGHELERLHVEMANTLNDAIDRLRRQFEIPIPGKKRYDDGTPMATGIGRFPGPGDITAFRPDFRVHGKYSKPCQVCGSPIQRIVRGDHETNYCPGCQTDGKILADRSLSRLLKDDWPQSIEEWERVIGDKK